LILLAMLFVSVLLPPKGMIINRSLRPELVVTNDWYYLILGNEAAAGPAPASFAAPPPCYPLAADPNM
jgi:hypothetical protein